MLKSYLKQVGYLVSTQPEETKIVANNEVLPESVSKNVATEPIILLKKDPPQKSILTSQDSTIISLNDIKIPDQSLHKDWKVVASIKGHFDSVRSVKFLPNGQKTILSASQDGTAKLYNISCIKKANIEIKPYFTFRGHTEAITSVAISQDSSTCFTSSVDSTIMSWKIPTSNDLYAPYGKIM